MYRRFARIALALALVTPLAGAPAHAADPVAPQSAIQTSASRVKSASVKITGTAQVGSKLRATTKAWKPRGTKLTYSWLRNGKRIKGASKSTYTLTAKDRGKRISVKVTGKKPRHKQSVRTSAKTRKVLSGKITARTPVVIGTPTVGATLTAAPGSWKPSSTTVRYQWLRNGSSIAGATKVSYALTAADLGKRVSVRTTGSKTGYTTQKRTSAATPAVASFYASRFGTFPVQTYSGTSDDIITFPAERVAILATVTHSGSGHFSIVSRTSSYEYGDLLVNTIGAYRGTTAAGLSTYDDPTGILEISASGPWSITVAPIDTAPSAPTTGAGDGVFKREGSAKVVSLSHQGSRNFIVQQHYEDAYYGWTWDLLVNEIGNYSGRKYLQPGPSIITVEADGSWSIY